jgi:cytochrome c biogenesis protein CcdA
MSSSKQHPTGGEGYQRILGASQADARRYLWSERLVMIAGIGSVIALGCAVILPLSESMHGTWHGFTRYLAGIIVLPLPFLLVLFVAARLHRRVARRYGLLCREHEHDA